MDAVRGAHVERCVACEADSGRRRRAIRSDNYRWRPW